MKNIKLSICILLVVLPGLSLWAKDFGLVLDQDLGYGGYGTNGNFDYSGILIPRFSALVGDRGDFFISAGFRADYQDTWIFAPELLRTDFLWRFDSGEFRIGRMQYSDPLGFIAQGLFDGLRLSLDTAAGTFSAGAWYTGLLYNKRANITMTPDEVKSNDTDLDYSDFVNTYFAPRRLVSALDWEQPGEVFRVNVSLLGQFDLSGGDYLHSQYLTAKIAAPYNDFIFSLGGCLELVEVPSELNFALAGELGATWILPASFESQLSLLGRFSSGVVENSSIVSFSPVSTVTQGDLLKAKLSGLSMISLDYTALLYRTFSLDVSSSYFIRSDLGTYHGYGTEGYFLGPEFFGKLLWSPVSDVQLNLGGGVFLPFLGNAAPNADVLWRVDLNVVLSLF